MNDTHYNKLKSIITPYLPSDVSVEEITPKSHLIKDLNVNSANMVDIILDVEDEFEIRLENEDMEKLETVQDALIIIDEKLTSP